MSGNKVSSDMTNDKINWVKGVICFVKNAVLNWTCLPYKKVITYFLQTILVQITDKISKESAERQRWSKTVNFKTRSINKSYKIYMTVSHLRFINGIRGKRAVFQSRALRGAGSYHCAKNIHPYSQINNNT